VTRQRTKGPQHSNKRRRDGQPGPPVAAAAAAAGVIQGGIEQDKSAAAAGAPTDEASQSQIQQQHSAEEEGQQGWPAAAWYLAGQGRFSAPGISDAPVKAAFTPLGDFLDRVGSALLPSVFGLVGSFIFLFLFNSL